MAKKLATAAEAFDEVVDFLEHFAISPTRASVPRYSIHWTRSCSCA